MNKTTVYNEITAEARAKINLALDVLGMLDNGYHEICSVMHSVSLCDDVAVKLSACEGENRVKIKISGAGFERIVPHDDRNTAVKAAYAFLKTAEITGCRVDIAIKKRVPVGAGLGGGSADAAAVICALNSMFGGVYGAEKLCEIGAAIGSDVPFCIRGGTMLARGRGELLSELPKLPNCEIVIVKPEFSVSTAELFRKIDSVKITARPDTDGMLKALAAGDLRGVAHRCYNVFEQALPDSQRGEIDEIKSRLLDFGALGSAMTGTGSAVFGIFEDEEAARTACNKLAADWRSFLCSSR